MFFKKHLKVFINIYYRSQKRTDKSYTLNFQNIAWDYQGAFLNHSYIDNCPGTTEIRWEDRQVSCYVQIIRSFLVLGYMISCDIIVKFWGSTGFVSWSITIKFYTLLPSHVGCLVIWFAIAYCLLELLELAQSHENGHFDPTPFRWTTTPTRGLAVSQKPMHG